MSDALLERIAVALEAVAKTYTGAAKTPSAAPTGGQSAADKGAAADAAKKTAATEAAAKAAAAKAAAAKTAGPAAGTKGPGGKYSIDQVREKIREVAANPNLGKQSAADILEDDGGGVKRVTDLKPENYDKVYEAAAVALQSEGGKAPTPATAEDDLM